MTHTRAPFAISLAFVVLGCAATPSEPRERPLGRVEQRFSSPASTLLTFEWSGYVDTDKGVGASETLVDNQALYTIGQLNGSLAVGRLDGLQYTGFTRTPIGAGARVAYHATMPVAWGGDPAAIPATYTLKLPREGSPEGAKSFFDKYKATCGGKIDTTVDDFWYDYRPDDCEISEDDLVTFTATVTRAGGVTDGKYPEYHKVWEDGELSVVAIFSKFDDNSDDKKDLGIAAFNDFVAGMKERFDGLELATTPTPLTLAPGPEVSDVTFSAKLADGKKAKVTAILLDTLSSPGPAFLARYEALSQKADLIAYSGHALLGFGVRELSKLGKWVPKQYTIFFFNACDTYAYLDDTLLRARAKVNPDDPKGTRYTDIVTNANPNFFNSMAESTGALVDGLLSYDAPFTFPKLLAPIDRLQVPVVTGEEDNVYVPGMK